MNLCFLYTYWLTNGSKMQRPFGKQKYRIGEQRYLSIVLRYYSFGVIIGQEKRIALDAKMFKKAKSLGYDAIVLIERTGRKKLEINRKPRSIELNLLNV